jgi:TetR/AcrR family transcriptional regulator
MTTKKELTTEELILEAAEKLFLEKGFAMTSTTEIAKLAGCNQALVHYYYRTKDKLFEVIFEKKIQLFASKIITAGNPKLSFQERLKERIEAHFNILKENPGIPFLLLNEFTTNPERLKKLKSKIKELPVNLLKIFEQELENEIKKGHIRKIRAIDLLATMFSLNVTLFLMLPLTTIVAEASNIELNDFIEHRKKENVRIILQSLKP